MALAETETSLASLCATVSKLPESITLLNGAVERQQELVGSAADVPIYALGLARSLTERARALDLSGRNEESADDFVLAYETFRRLADAYPHRPDYRLEVGFAIHNIGRIDQKLVGDIESPEFNHVDIDKDEHPMETRYHEAIAVQESLVAGFPAIVENHRRLATTMNSLAIWLGDKSSYVSSPEVAAATLAESGVVHQRAEEIMTELVSSYPSVVAYKNDLSRCHQRYNIILQRMGRLDEAEARYRQSISIQAQLAADFPDVASHRILLLAWHCNPGANCDQRNDLFSAECEFRAAMEFGRQAYTINPLNSVTRLLLSLNNDNLASVLLRTGRHQEALPLVNEALQFWPGEWWNSKPVFARYQECARAASNDPHLSIDERDAEVRKCEEQTMEVLADLVTRATHNTQDLPFFLNTEAALDHVRHRTDFQQIVLEATKKFAKSN